MQPIPPDHPFAQACERYGCTCEYDPALELSMIRSQDDRVSFYGDTTHFLAAMAQKRHYKLLPKMLYLARLGASPTFLVERPILWSDHMMKLECERMADPLTMLSRFFTVVTSPAERKMKESANVLACGFRPTGFRYNCEGSGSNYELDISLTYDVMFVRHVFTLAAMAEHLNVPKDVLTWMGEVGSPPWWSAMREVAMSRSVSTPELELPDMAFA